MTRGLKRAILLSILFHLVILFSASQLTWLPEPSGRTADNAVEVVLRPGRPERPAELPAQAPILGNAIAIGGTRELLPSPVAERGGASLQEFSRSTASDHVAIADRIVPARDQPTPTASATAVAAEPVSLDGIRQYRLSLAREARQSRTYPASAREQGWEGVVVVVVTTVAGLPGPQVTLSQSSGHPLLDRAAIELVALAVINAPIPESLRGRQFALTLPIHYQLAD
jgi:protein TonB